MRILLSAGVLLFALSIGSAQDIAPNATEDSDHDGLSDALEDALLAQFTPQFMVSADDCSGRPAVFVPFEETPVVQAENGAIYGQVFPRAGHADQVEVHYYHLCARTAEKWATTSIRNTYLPCWSVTRRRSGKRCTGTLQHTKTRSAMRAK